MLTPLLEMGGGRSCFVLVFVAAIFAGWILVEFEMEKKKEE